MGETMTIQEVVSTVLADTLDLVATPEKWTQCAYARDVTGWEISDPVGTPVVPKCYCIDGALRRVVHVERRDWLHEQAAAFGDDEDPIRFRSAVYKYANTAACEAFRTMFRDRIEQAHVVDYCHDLWAWNDTGVRSHADVVAGLKLAITREGKEIVH